MNKKLPSEISVKPDLTKDLKENKQTHRHTERHTHKTNLMLIRFSKTVSILTLFYEVRYCSFPDEAGEMNLLQVSHNNVQGWGASKHVP